MPIAWGVDARSSRRGGRIVALRVLQLAQTRIGIVCACGLTYAALFRRIVLPLTTRDALMHIGIYVYPDAEVLDFAGPFEVFSTANRLAETGRGVGVSLIAEHLEPVTARGGFQVQPHASLNRHAPLAALIVPGGVHHAQLHKQHVMAWLQAQAQCTQIMASVCTGAFLLAQAGVIKHQRVTTHWEDIPDLRARFPRLDVVDQVRWVDEGSVITSAGISAGIDMSLHLLARLCGQHLARATARQMEYDWRQA